MFNLEIKVEDIQEAINKPVDGVKAFRTITTWKNKRELDRAEWIQTYQYYNLNQLALEIDNLESGTKVRVIGYPNFEGTETIDNGATTYNSRYKRVTSRRYHAAMDRFVTETRNHGETINADVRATTYSLHKTKDSQPTEVSIVTKDHVESISEVGVDHVDAPPLEKVKLDSNVPIMVLGKIIINADGKAQILVDQTITQKAPV